MAGAAKKWAMGCGIGCGLLIIIAGGIGTCGYLGVKKITEGAEGLEGGFEQLAEIYGEPGQFAPAGDGTIPFDRIELFLAIRDETAPARDKMEGTLAILDKEGSGNFVAKIKAGMNLVPDLFGFVDERNRVLADRGMGLGEYSYIYSVSYYSWLGKSLADGPSFQITGRDQEDDSNVRWGVNSSDENDVREQREEDLRRELHDIQRQMLNNQLAAAESLALDEAWLMELRAEAEAMDDRRRRLLWEGDVPEPLRGSLEPFRVRLEESYSPLMNAVEMGLVQHD